MSVEKPYLITFDTVNRTAPLQIETPQLSNDPGRFVNVVGSDDTDNTTNDVLIEFKSNPLRLPAATLGIGSLEIPQTQHTIEKLWNQLYFSEHYSPRGTTSGIFDSTIDNIDAPLAKINMEWSLSSSPSATNDINMFNAIAWLPLLNNPVTKILVDQKAATAIFTTKEVHSLHLSDLYSTFFENSAASNITFNTIWLIGTPIATVVTLNKSNPNFTILNDFEFQLSNLNALSASQWNSLATQSPITGHYGYVVAPPIPSPEQLCTLLTASIASLDPILAANQVRLQFDKRSHQTIFTWTPLGNGILKSISILAEPNNNDSLATQLGFINTAVINRQKRASHSFTYLHFSLLKLDSGTYHHGTQVAQNLELQWLRYYFEPQDLSSTDVRPRFAFTSGNGTLYMIPVPYGLYSPDMLALFLTTQMNLLTNNLYNYQVQFFRDTFTFTSNSVFSLEFGLANQASVPVVSPYSGVAWPSVGTRLGFGNVPYRGSTRYSSIYNAYLPLESTFHNIAAGERTRQRPNNFIWFTTYNQAMQKFTFDVSHLKGIPVTITFNNNSIVCTSSSIAHGLLEQELISIIFNTIGPTNNTFNVLITNIIDAFQFTIDVGSLFTNPIGSTSSGGTEVANWSLVSNLPAMVRLAYIPTANLFTAPLYAASTVNNGIQNNIPQFNQIPSSLIGFPEVDSLWTASASIQTAINKVRSSLSTTWIVQSIDTQNLRTFLPLTSPNTIDLDTVPYILVEVSDPSISTTLQHRWKQDVRTNLLAKILFHAPGSHKTERFLQVQGTLNGGNYSMLTQLRIRLLNPNHTLYQLHNKNWSGTFVITSLTDRAQLQL